MGNIENIKNSQFYRVTVNPHYPEGIQVELRIMELLQDLTRTLTVGIGIEAAMDSVPFSTLKTLISE